MTDNAVFEHDQITEETGRNGMSGSNIIGMELMKKQHGATVSFHSIHYRVEQKGGPICRRTTVHKDSGGSRVNITQRKSGIMRPGLNAIKYGKFLDVLAARKDPAGLSGEVLINGALQPPNFKLCHLKRLMGTLTVRENFSFSAALRLSSQISPREKEARVNHLISELGLNKVADTKVGTQLIRGISSGERKRTSIGMELIIDPSVLFLDEPTTGLDASTAHSVLLLLKRMACQGRTVIMSIHQPRYSIYRLFDSLTLLANGKQVYHGPTQDALDYFSNIGYACEAHNNPADFFLDVINGSSAAVNMTKIQNNGDFEFEVAAVSQQCIEDQLVEKYKNCKRITWAKDNNIRAKCHTVTYNSTFFHQLRWVLWRTFWNLMLNPQTSVAQLAVTTLMAAIVGAIFYGVKDDQSGIQNRFGVLFFITTNQCFSTLSAAELFITERKLFIGLKCSNLCFAGLKPTAAAFFIFMLTVILVSCAAASMTMAISADQSVVAMANIFMTISFIFMMIFSGLLVNLKSTMDWLSWLKNVYSFEQALEINEFVGLKFCGNVSTVMSSPAADVLMCTGEQHLTFQGINYSSWGFWHNHMALTVLTLIFLIIGYIKLRFIHKFS
uniref:ABC-type xenobiotic transporter n=1 Tax=Sinocyclocheilus anshuiensis TaxID=1608454 RepID=A0A671SLQ8_9TELE